MRSSAMPADHPSVRPTGRPTGRPARRLLAAVTAALTGTAGLLGATPGPATAGPADYAFMRVAADGLPERWDPCRVIGYKVNLDGAPSGALADVQETFRRIAEVGGLRFEHQGATSVVPRPGGPDAGTDLVVAWTAPDSGNRWAPSADTLGSGGYSTRSSHNHRGAATMRIVSGFVLMNSQKDLTPGFGPVSTSQPPTRGQVLLHETAHAMGLAHVEAPSEILNPRVPQGLDGFGEGDRNGLREVGVRHGCFADTSAGTSATPPPEPAPAPRPGPTEAPATTRVPSLSVSPGTVAFGQTAVVSITGDPGSAVDLYTRKYPNTAFTRIRTGLVLDSSGRTTVSTKPDVNLRFMARAQQQADPAATSNQPLMTVRKNVSMSVRRVGTRQYTFSGSIHPWNPGAVVHLYRGGRLLKGSIPVSSSRVYSVTLTVEGGRADSQVRSPATGYNDLSLSPAVTMTPS